MFSVLPLRTSLPDIPQYETHLIHFAVSYKGSFALPASWLTKFERLLSKLCWFDAVAICEGYAYQWAVEKQNIIEQFQSDPPLPASKWRFDCVELLEKSVNASVAIDGAFKSDHHIN